MFHYNMLALIDGIQPKVLGLHDMLAEYIKHRQTVVRRRTQFELKKLKTEHMFLKGFQLLLIILTK